jgi:hypothetical protein
MVSATHCCMETMASAPCEPGIGHAAYQLELRKKRKHLTTSDTCLACCLPSMAWSQNQDLSVRVSHQPTALKFLENDENVQNFNRGIKMNQRLFGMPLIPESPSNQHHWRTKQCRPRLHRSAQRCSACCVLPSWCFFCPARNDSVRARCAKSHRPETLGRQALGNLGKIWNQDPAQQKMGSNSYSC